MKHTDVNIEDHELRSKLIPAVGVGPYEQDSRDDSADKVVKSPPTLDTRPIYLEDALTNSQGTIVPHQQEHET